METREGFAPLYPQHLDPEAFRRVWNRVMPDQKDSPIVLTPPAPRKPQPKPPHPAPRPEAPSLKELLEELRSALLQAQLLARRTGGNRALLQLAAHRQQALRQLNTAWFLTTGRRFQSHTQPPPPSADLAQALREQFLWEQKWARDSLAAAEAAKDPSLAEQLRELSYGSQPRLRTIRSLLERM